MQLQRLTRVVSISVSSPGYPYLPYLPGESQGGDAQSSSPIESSRRCDDFKFEFGYFSLTDFSPASTILKVIVLRVALCNMRKKSNIRKVRFSESGQSYIICISLRRTAAKN